MVPDHLGPLHPVEQLLVVVLAFGPFLLLALTIWISRRRHAAEDEDRSPGSPDRAGSAGRRPPGRG